MATAKRIRLQKASTVVVDDDNFLLPKGNLPRARSTTIPFSDSAQSLGVQPYVVINKNQEPVVVTHSGNS